MTRKKITKNFLGLCVLSFFIVSLWACSGDSQETAEKTLVPATPKLPELSGATLYRSHCSGCHGAKGAGDGPTKLKRPARSFADGGFAFGNTEKAIFRTVTKGMPGKSEMPSFEDKLSKDERLAIVRHVRTLIPAAKIIDDIDTIMIVKDRPLILRGILPPLREDLPLRPRGLLMGLKAGISLEYRIDDVRLLALRSGGFAKRTDWVNRGGTPIQPTGQVRILFGKGDPRPTFSSLVAGKVSPLESKMRGSFAFPEMVGLSYDILGTGKDDPIHVKEASFPQSLSHGYGVGRRFLVAPHSVDLILHLDQGSVDQTWDGRDEPYSNHDPHFPTMPLVPLKPVVRKNPNKSALVLVYKGADKIRLGMGNNDMELLLPASKQPQEVKVILIAIEEYSMKSLQKVAGEVNW